MNYPIKVLQVFTILDRGGAESNLMSYYRKLDQSKVQFDFLVHRASRGAYEDEIEKLGGNIFRLPAIHPLTLKGYKKAVRAFFDQYGHQYQVIHGQLSELGVFIYEEAQKRGVPVIISHAHNTKMPLDKKAIFRWLWKMQMKRHINAYFSCGEEASIWFFGKDKAKEAYVMNNSIEADKFRYSKELETKFRKELHAENTLNFVHVGNFTFQKNHNFLIDVFNEIQKKEPASKLFLIGSDKNTNIKEKIVQKLKQYNIEDKVVFMGGRSNINELLQAMDCFIFPSLFEGFGIAYLEAQASGLPCFISEFVPEEANIVPENTFRISLSESADKWATEIIKVSKTFAKSSDIPEIIIAKGYDAENNAKQLVDKYIELVKRNSGK